MSGSVVSLNFCIRRYLAVDLGDLEFGRTEGYFAQSRSLCMTNLYLLGTKLAMKVDFDFARRWFKLQDNAKARGEWMNPKRRLSVGRIMPLSPIEGEICLRMEAFSDLAHVPGPPPLDVYELFARSVMQDVLEMNPGANRYLRDTVIADMWKQQRRDEPEMEFRIQQELEEYRRQHLRAMHEALFSSAVDGVFLFPSS